MKFEEMDDQVTIREQMELEMKPVFLINKFNVAADEADRLVEAWTADAAFMKAQPGYISTQLFRGIGGSGVFINYAVWENTESFRRAFSHPDFKGKLDAYPSSAITAPHLFQKVAVPGLCLGDD